MQSGFRMRVKCPESKFSTMDQRRQRSETTPILNEG